MKGQQQIFLWKDTFEDGIVSFSSVTMSKNELPKSQLKKLLELGEEPFLKLNINEKDKKQFEP